MAVKKAVGSTGFPGRLRAVAGTCLRDKPFLAWPLFASGLAGRRWVEFHNRGERLVPSPAGRGYDCDWEWTSDLTVARVLPKVGHSLLRAALSERPIEFSSTTQAPGDDPPDVSFVIGHRGQERLPLLLATLASLQAQTGCHTEILVVEQSTKALLREALPAGVRWVHQVPADAAMPYSRSWAFNEGAREARGRIVVLHDNDILAPATYARELVMLEAEGFEAMRLMRLLFYVGEEGTKSLLSGDGPSADLLRKQGPELVRQNCQGGSIAVTREAYFRIGGHDEGFVGWGGEDNEFFDRCGLLRLYTWGYLPFVHLWHRPQAGKVRPAGTRNRLGDVMAVSAGERAQKLAGSLQKAFSPRESGATDRRAAS